MLIPPDGSFSDVPLFKRVPQAGDSRAQNFYEMCQLPTFEMSGLTQNPRFDLRIEENRRFLFEVLDWYETVNLPEKRPKGWLELINDEAIAYMMRCSPRWVRHLQRQGIFKLATDNNGKAICGRYFAGPTVRRIVAMSNLRALCGGAEFDIGLTTYCE